MKSSAKSSSSNCVLLGPQVGCVSIGDTNEEGWDTVVAATHGSGFNVESGRFCLSSGFDFCTFMLKVGIGGVGTKLRTLRLLKVQPI